MNGFMMFAFFFFKREAGVRVVEACGSSNVFSSQLRIRELAVQSANGTYTARDRDNLEIESAGLIKRGEGKTVGLRCLRIN